MKGRLGRFADDQDAEKAAALSSAGAGMGKSRRARRRREAAYAVARVAVERAELEQESKRFAAAVAELVEHGMTPMGARLRVQARRREQRRDNHRHEAMEAK